MKKAKKGDPSTPDKNDDGSDGGTPSKGVKGFLTRRISTLLDSINSIASSQKTYNALLMKKMGITLPGDLAEFQVTINYVEQYALTEAKVEKVPNPLNLNNNQVIFEPVFVILVWEGKGKEFTSISLSDAFGIDGPFIISLRNKLKELWPKTNLKEICGSYKILAHGYLALRHQLESLPQTETKDTETHVKIFFETYRDLINQLRQNLIAHHVNDLRKKVGDAAADKFAASLGILAPENNPVNSGNAVKSAVINMTTKQGRQRNGGPHGGSPSHRQQRKKRVRDDKGRQACDHCGEMVPFKGFVEHNKVCTKKKP